jgi:hypothetical protein
MMALANGLIWTVAIFIGGVSVAMVAKLLIVGPPARTVAMISQPLPEPAPPGVRAVAMCPAPVFLCEGVIR